MWVNDIFDEKRTDMEMYTLVYFVVSTLSELLSGLGDIYCFGCIVEFAESRHVWRHCKQSIPRSCENNSSPRCVCRRFLWVGVTEIVSQCTYHSPLLSSLSFSHSLTPSSTSRTNASQTRVSILIIRGCA